MRTRLLATVFGCLGCSVSLGCSAVDGGGHASDETEFAEGTEAFGEASCATAVADATFTPTGERIALPPYTNSACANSLVVDILDFAAYTPPGYVPPQVYTQLEGFYATSSNRCTSSRLKTQLYQRLDEAWVSIASKETQGQWFGSGWCWLSGIDQTADMEDGNDYRVVVSGSRDYPTPTQIGVSVESSAPFSTFPQPEEPPPGVPGPSPAGPNP